MQITINPTGVINFKNDTSLITLEIVEDGIVFKNNGIPVITLKNDNTILLNNVSITSDGYINIDGKNLIDTESLSDSLNKLKTELNDSIQTHKSKGKKNHLMMGAGDSIDSSNIIIDDNGNLHIPTTIFADNIILKNALKIQSVLEISNTNSSIGKYGDMLFNDNFLYVKTKRGWKRTELKEF